MKINAIAALAIGLHRHDVASSFYKVAPNSFRSTPWGRGTLPFHAAAFCGPNHFCFGDNGGNAARTKRRRKGGSVRLSAEGDARRSFPGERDRHDAFPHFEAAGSDEVEFRARDVAAGDDDVADGRGVPRSGGAKGRGAADALRTDEPKAEDGGAKARLARATASLLARRKQEGSFDPVDDRRPSSGLSFSSPSSSSSSSPRAFDDECYADDEDRDGDDDHDDDDGSPYNNLIGLTKKIDQKILTNNFNRWSGQTRPMRANERHSAGGKASAEALNHVQHEAMDSMQSLLGYNSLGGEWSDRNSTTYHVAIVFGKPLIRDQVTVEYATRIRTLARMLKEEESFRPSLICFTGGVSGDNSVSDAAAGYVYFRHLCGSQNIAIDDARTKVWVDDAWHNNNNNNNNNNGNNEREAMESIASELWRNYIKGWLKERPLTERLNQHYGVGWTILERRVDIHFTLVSTEYHLCNLNDVHHRSPGRSFLQPLVTLRGLVGSDRWVNKEELEVMDPGYSSSVHVRNGRNGASTSSSDRGSFGGIENSVDTSWSFQYGTYPFLHGNDDAVVFLGQCFLLGEELTPLLVNMKGVVEQTEFFQRDNYLLLSSIRRSFVSLVEALYTDRGQEIRAGVIQYFERSGRNRFTKEDVKIIVVLESALLNLGRCIDLVKPAGLLVSSVPAATWSKALVNLEESMSRIKTVCDPDQPLEAVQWGKLFDDE